MGVSLKSEAHAQVSQPVIKRRSAISCAIPIRQPRSGPNGSWSDAEDFEAFAGFASEEGGGLWVADDFLVLWIPLDLAIEPSCDCREVA